MIKFFRKIRYNLMEQNKTGKYLKYAIGEIILVVIGILIALSINNWNENKKINTIERDIYKNLITSLHKDSTELNRIINFQFRSLKCQEAIITNSFTSLRDSLGIDELKIVIEEVTLGSLSFFPKYGVYNTIISESRMQIIKSDSIKSLLIELYDYEYKRYQTVDALLDEKYFNEFDPFIIRSIGMINGRDKKVFREMDLELLEKNYDELVLQCGSIYKLTDASFALLNNIYDKVNHLLVLLRHEISNT